MPDTQYRFCALSRQRQVTAGIGDDTEAPHGMAQAAKEKRKGKKAAKIAAGATIRVGERLAVALMASDDDILASAGGGASGACGLTELPCTSRDSRHCAPSPTANALSFQRDRLLTRRKRSREMLVSNRIGVAVDFARR